MKPFLRFIIFLVFANLQPLFAQDPLRFKDEVKSVTEKEYVIDRSQKVILFTGSSTIRLWTTLQENFPADQVFNTGFGGSQMSDLLFYSDQLISPFKPDQIFIYEGDNDLADGRSIDSIMINMKGLVTKILDQFPKTKLVFIGPKPSLQRWHLKTIYQLLNEKMKEFAGKTKQVRFISLWDEMLDEKGEPRKDIFIADGLHMNQLGYEIWAKKIEPEILR